MSILLSQASLGSGLQPSASASLQDLSKRRDSESTDSVTGSRIGLRSPSCSPTLGEFRLGGGPSSNSLAAGRNVPVHCVVERVPGPQSCSPTGEPGVPTVEQDSFAIVPHGTPFNDLVRTALLRLGYSASEAVGAKGAIQLKNWKPLAFDQITDAPEATVGEILGELFTVATLRVRLYSRPRVNAAHEVKEKLLQVLLAQSHTLLVSSGCPIDQSMLSALTKGRFECDLSEETRKKFDQWYLQQIFHHCRQVALAHQQQQQQLSRQSHRQVEALRSPESSPQQSHPHHNNTVAVAHHHHSQQQSQQHSMVEQQHQHQQPPQSSGRTRIRTSFDPELELPKLHRWFTENQHPSRLQIQQYVKELNSLESRRGRKPLDVNNVVYWFKNARAAYKRAEQRYCNEANGIQSPALPDAASDGEARNGMADTRMCGPDPKDYMGRSFVDLGKGNGGEGALSSHSDVPDDVDLSSFTLDLSLRRSCKEDRRQSEAGSEEDGENDTVVLNQEESADATRIKEEPKDSGSDVSGADSDESDDLDMDVSDDVAMTSRDEEELDEEKPGVAEESSSHANHQHNGGKDAGGGEGQPPTPQSQLSRQGENSGDVPLNAYAMSASGSPEERRKRNRTFIDPMTEVPRLEQWFSMDTHPVHRMIVRYTEDLNSLPYRQKFPKLEPKNIQFWFKNRRAKCKRLNLASMKERSTSGIDKS